MLSNGNEAVGLAIDISFGGVPENLLYHNEIDTSNGGAVLHVFGPDDVLHRYRLAPGTPRVHPSVSHPADG